MAALAAVAARYIAAYRAKTATRRETAPKRRRFAKGFELNLGTSLKGTLIFVRRGDDNGSVHLLGKTFHVDQHWPHRLVRCEVDFTDDKDCRPYERRFRSKVKAMRIDGR